MCLCLCLCLCVSVSLSVRLSLGYGSLSLSLSLHTHTHTHTGRQTHRHTARARLPYSTVQLAVRHRTLHWINAGSIDYRRAVQTKLPVPRGISATFSGRSFVSSGCAGNCSAPASSLSFFFFFCLERGLFIALPTTKTHTTKKRE